MEQENIVDISSGVLIIVEDKILLVKHTNEYGGNFSIPKGRLEKGETLLNNALRELEEETGVRLSTKDVTRFPEILHLRSKDGIVVKRVYYFIARFENYHDYKNKWIKRKIDNVEIEKVVLLKREQAEVVLPISQLSVLHHINHKFPIKELLYLLNKRFISRSRDSNTGLYIYNYTKKCKDVGYWNYTTLSCRGLILDKNYNVVARPFKKFFEWNNIHEELQQHLKISTLNANIISFEKLDGSLAILFNYEGDWYITNRKRFDIIQSFQSRILLNNKSDDIFSSLNEGYTYLLENTINHIYNVLDYDVEDLFMLCAVKNIDAEIIFPETNFRHVEKLNFKKFDMSIEIGNVEGIVYYLGERFFIKTKTKWFYEKFNKKRDLLM